MKKQPRYICSKDHPEISYQIQSCPVCELISLVDTQAEIFESLVDLIEILDSEII